MHVKVLREVHSADSDRVQWQGCCGDANGPSGSIKAGNFLTNRLSASEQGFHCVELVNCINVLMISMLVLSLCDVTETWQTV
jgi:hypothetical protein